MDESQIKKDRQIFQMQKKGFDDIKQSLESLKKIQIEGVDLISIKGKNGEPGKDGYSPEKGKDYFTKEEQNLFVKEIMSQIRVPKDGEPGKNAEVDYKKIENFVKKEVSKIPKPKELDPIDYGSIISTVLEKIPTPDPIIIDYELIKDFVNKNIKEIDNRYEERWSSLTRSAGPRTRLEEMSDVDVTGLKSGQVLQWNGSKWVPYTPTDLDQQTLQSVTGFGATTNIESTFSGGLISTGLKANSSAGITLKSNAGTDIALLGAGGGAGATFYGGVNLNTMTAGSIPFFGASGLFSQNNSNLFWDNTNKRLGIGTNSPSAGYSSNVILDVKGNTTNFGAQIFSESNDGTQHINLFSGLGGSDPGAAIIFKGSQLRIGSETDTAFGSYSNMMTINSSGLITTTNGLSAGTTASYGYLTAVGGNDFTGSLPALGTASIGRITTTGWDGSGFIFANSLSGNYAFSIIYNADRAYFGQLTTSGYTGLIMGTWDNVGLTLGSASNPLNRLDVNGAIATGSYANVYTAPIGGAIFSGNVGIGTTSPGSFTAGFPYKLKVQDTGNFFAGIESTGANAYLSMKAAGAESALYWYTGGNTSGSRQFRMDNTSDGLQIDVLNDTATIVNKNVAVFKANGNVGIGTISPSEVLDVNGNIKGTGYKSSDGSAGISTTITTASLVGKTITIKNGLITGFA